MHSRDNMTVSLPTIHIKLLCSQIVQASNDPNIDLSSVLEGEGSLLSYYPVQEKFSDPLKQWLATSRHAQHRKLDEDDFAPVNLYDDAMRDEDIFDPSGGRGEWMI